MAASFKRDCVIYLAVTKSIHKINLYIASGQKLIVMPNLGEFKVYFLKELSLRSVQLYDTFCCI